MAKCVVHVADDGRLFGNVVHLAFARDLDPTAMPGVDGSFPSIEGVDLTKGKLRTIDLSSAMDNLSLLEVTYS